MNVAPFPLHWPVTYPRTQSRTDALFKVDFAAARDELLRELALLGARRIVVSSDVPTRKDGTPGVPSREPSDPGVAVYFQRKDQPYVIACDQFRRVRWNVRAIGNTVAALRTIERNGTSRMLEQAFSGFAQLPQSTTRVRGWREVLELLPDVNDANLVKLRYPALALRRHPDRGGSHEQLVELNAAFEAAMKELAP